MTERIMNRKMATIRRIDKIEPIPDADKIVKATVGGWTLVTAITNGFKEGDLVVYCEIDSFIPTAIAPFLTKAGHYPKTVDGVEGERLRTMRLRGVLSQGLLLPVSVLDFDSFYRTEIRVLQATPDCVPNVDVSAVLGITKYEAPIPAALAGEVKGMFPSQIPKTDQERIQNLTAELEVWKASGLSWEVTEKLDGCLVEGTQISTPGGNIAVENINVGDKIISFNHDTSLEEESIVTGVLHREVETDWYEIETDDGTVLTVTANHPVFVTGINCYRRADQLKIGDNLTKKL